MTYRYFMTLLDIITFWYTISLVFFILWHIAIFWNYDTLILFWYYDIFLIFDIMTGCYVLILCHVVTLWYYDRSLLYDINILYYFLILWDVFDKDIISINFLNNEVEKPFIFLISFSILISYKCVEKLNVGKSFRSFN